MGKNTAFVCLLFTLLGSAFCDDCKLPPDSGSCATADVKDSKEDIRFYYSSVNFKCTEFPYSGCGGNANNFKNVEDCKRKCGKTLIDNSLIQGIESAQSQLKCFYGNKTYSIQESIPEATKDSPCAMGCFCSSGSRPGQSTKITCASVDCQPYPDQDNCVPVHKDGVCCPEYYCPPEGKPETVFKCQYKGKEYVEGQTIYPDDYPCVSCTCNKSFKGVLSTEGGVCKEVNCGLQIHNQGNLVNRCIPKFYTLSSGRQSCCPIEWNCKQN